MDSSSTTGQPSLVRNRTIRSFSYLALVFSVGAIFMALWAAIGASNAPTTAAPLQFDLPPTQVPTITPSPTIPLPPLIAIVAGHWSHVDPQGVTTVHDVGSVCDDGLREVTINKAVADKVVDLLKARGYRVDLLEEFDARLNPTYAPNVFLSIHSDACVHGPDYIYSTGYKIAHAEPSDIPQEDDRLVSCLRRDYQRAVDLYRLAFDWNTITDDMTEYHGFREIVPKTPAAIIELGFMYQDRAILTGHQDELARAIASGLDSFLKNDQCMFPTPTPTPQR